MVNSEYERKLILAELRQYVQKCEEQAKRCPEEEWELKEQIEKGIQWHKEMLKKYS